MSDEAPAAETDAAAATKAAKPAKAKGSKLVGLLLLANLGGTGFVGYQSLQQTAAAEAAAEAVAAAIPKTPEEKAKEAQKAKEKEKEVGPVTSIDPFIVNLNEPDATRYLKATFELEVASPAVIAALEKQKRMVRDELLRYLSGLSVADTQGELGKEKIQHELISRLNRMLGHIEKGDSVKRLFFV